MTCLTFYPSPVLSSAPSLFRSQLGGWGGGGGGGKSTHRGFIDVNNQRPSLWQHVRNVPQRSAGAGGLVQNDLNALECAGIVTPARAQLRDVGF